MSKRPADSRRGAMLKGAVVGLAGHAAFAVVFYSLTPGGEPAAGEQSGAGTLLLFHAAALAPTLVAGAGLGWLARRSCRARALVLVLGGLAACVGVFAATFALVGGGLSGLWFGALMAVVFGAFLVPIGIASGLVLTAWVRPPGLRPQLG